MISPPIQDGFIVCRNDRIVKIGRWPASGMIADGHTVDLGDVAVLPAMVNAHTHLEFSDLDQPIGTPGIELADWIGEVIRHRSSAPITGGAASAIAKGMRECQQTGTGLIAEIATTPWAGEPVQHGVETIAFAETLGLSCERGDAKWELARQHLIRHGARSGVSPHAPYSTPPELIQRCVELARHYDRPLAMHVAESPAERELLATGGGPFADRLSAMGLNVEPVFPWPASSGSRLAAGHGSETLQLIQWLARSPTALLIHGNDLQTDEIAEIARHQNMSVVFCPRTHSFFAHDRHPVGRLVDAGINVALGTDSRASNPDLNLWREARFLLNHRQDLSPADVIAMATHHGAIALRRQSDFGSLSPNRIANWVSIPSDANDLETLHAQLAGSDVTPIRLASNDADQS